jgi:hypothetical protein
MYLLVKKNTKAPGTISTLMPKPFTERLDSPRLAAGLYGLIGLVYLGVRFGLYGQLFSTGNFPSKNIAPYTWSLQSAIPWGRRRLKGTG